MKAEACEWDSSFGPCKGEVRGAYRTMAPHSLDPDGLRRYLCTFHGSQVLRAGGSLDVLVCPRCKREVHPWTLKRAAKCSSKDWAYCIRNDDPCEWK